MTTAVWTPGMIAIDSCITHQDENDAPQYKTTSQKLFFKVVRGYVVAIGSEGDMDGGIATDETVVEQAIQFLRNNNYDRAKIHRYLNQDKFVKERQSRIGEGRYEGLLFITKKANHDVLLVCGNGRIQFVSDATRYVAIGVDAPVALGALYHGADAVTAVKAACKHAMYTDYPIHAVCATKEDGTLLYVLHDEHSIETFKNLK